MVASGTKPYALSSSTKLLDEKEAAELIHMSIHFLRRDRITRRLVPFVRIGRSVRYLEEDLDRFIRENSFGSKRFK